MISNFKLFPYFNISQHFVQNVQKQKKTTSVLSCVSSFPKTCTRESTENLESAKSITGSNF